MLKHPAAKEAINMPDLFKTQGENTPLTLALKTQQWDMAQALLDAGADPKIACAFGGTPLHLACILYGGGDENNSKIAKIITILVNKGANPAQQDSEGLSACDYFKKRWDEDDCKSVTYCKIQYDKDGAVVRNDENDPVVLEEISMPLKEFYRKYPDAKKDEGYGFCFYNTQDGKEFSCSTQNMPLDCQNLGSWFWDHGVDRRSFTTHRTEFLESAVGKLEVQKLSALLEPGKVKAIQPNF
jgi:hypothetical protein